MNKCKYVVGFAFNQGALLKPQGKNDQVVLIRKLKPDWQRDRWNGPGGSIEEGETPEQAMVREYLEETGVEITEWELFAVLECEDAEVFFFRAFTDLIFETYTATQELVARHYLQALPSRRLPNLHWLIPMALNSAPDQVPYRVYEPGVAVSAA